MEETRKDKLQLIVRRFFLIITDIILVNGCVFISLVMRFNVDLAAILRLLPLLYSGVSECITVCGSMRV